MTTTRSRSDFIPIGATKIVREGVKAEAFLFTNPQGRPCAMGFRGRAIKPGFHYHYPSPESRSRHLDRWFDGLEEDATRKAQERAQRYQPHDLKAGDILVASWGYDQTNVDFYEVAAVVGKNTVELVQVACQTDDSGWGEAMCDHVVPVPGRARSGRFRARVDMSSGTAVIRVSYGGFARVWDGKPKFRSWWR